MASSYTSRTGIEKPATGEQSGTWGDTTNTNFDIIDTALNGVVTLSLSGTSSTLTTSEGTVTDGMNRMILCGGSPSGEHTITISPNDAEKIYFITNNLIAEKTHQEYHRADKINVISVMWNVFDIQRLKGENNLPMKVRADMEYKYKSVNTFKM